MTSREDAFARFKSETGQLLTDEENREVKGALGAFMETKDVQGLVEGMYPALSSKSKRKIYETVGDLLPSNYRDEYKFLVEQIPDEGGDAGAGAGASASLSPSSSSSSGPQLGDEDFLPVRLPSAGPLSPAPAPPAEAVKKPRASVNLGLRDVMGVREGEREREREGGDDLFDLVFAMAEADLEREREKEKQKGETPTDEERRVVRQRMRLSQKGFKFQAFAQRKNTHAGPVRSFVEHFSRFLSKHKTREETEQELIQDGLEAGVFLVRNKTDFSGSFKIKPGQARPSHVWVFSHVQKDRSVSHLLVEQKERGRELTIADQRYGNCCDIESLVLYFFTHEIYEITRGPFTCQPWFKERATREEAEELLSSTSSGTFLVRTSQSDPGSYVLSLYTPTHPHTPVHHYKLTQSDAGWVTAVAPHTLHTSIARLIAHHSHKPNGFFERLIHGYGEQ